MIQNRKNWLYLMGGALLLLLLKYSDSIFQTGQLFLSILMPMFIGCAIAYVLNVLVVKVETLPILKKSIIPGSYKRLISVLGAIVIFLLVIIMVVQIVLPQLVEAFGVVLKGIPPMLEQTAAWLATQKLPVPELQQWLSDLNINWPQLVQKAITYLSSGVSNLFSVTVTALGSIGGIVMQMVVSFIFALYLLFGKEKLGYQFGSLMEVYLKESVTNRLLYALNIAHDTFTKFIVGQCTEAVIIGVLCTLGMMLFRFPYATMIGTLIGATALLPIVGAYLGAAIGAFMILTVNPLQAVAFLVFIVVLQQLEGNLIYPRVVGSSIGLPGIWVLVAVTVGGGIGGIVGMLLAVPTAATAYKLVKQDVVRRKQGMCCGKGDSQDKSEPSK